MSDDELKKQNIFYSILLTVLLLVSVLTSWSYKEKIPFLILFIINTGLLWVVTYKFISNSREEENII